MRKFLLFSFLLLTVTSLFAQTRVIKGKVTSADDGTSIPGVTVMVKGTTTGTQTNVDGNYEITAGSGATLVYSYIGMVSHEEAVGNRSIINVALQSDERSLSEVVVTALGIQREQKALGYAVSKVDPATVLQKSEPDLLKGLQGKVPGVDIRASQGVPGSATRIQIRGISSFGLDTEPLIVVDGIPYSNTQLQTSSQSSGGGAYGNAFSNLDPNDIESVNILKGAAAASLYGSRASRGVLLITTKSGSGKKGAKPINVSFRSGLSIEEIADIPEFQNTYGAGANFRAQGANGSWGAKFGQGNIYDALGNTIRRSSSGLDSIPATTWATMYNSYPELFPNGMIAYQAVPGNVKALFETGKLYENSVSINGGEGKTTFNATLSNVNHDGYVMNTSYIRNNISIGGQTNYRKLTIGGNLGYTRANQTGGFFGQTQSFLTGWGRTFTMARNWDIAGYPTTTRDGRQIGFNDNQYTNPIWAAYHNVIKTTDDRITARAYASYQVNSWINVNYNLGVNNSGIFRDEVIDKTSYGSADNALGKITEDNYRFQEIQSTLVATFAPKLNGDFSLDFKVGNDINQRMSRRQAQQGVGFIVDGVYNLMNTNTKRFLADDRTKRRLVGFFGDVTLGYKNFAFINLTGRQDITSTLPFKNASYFYPGVSASLVYTDALNIQSGWFDYGKLRVGYAKVGNDAGPHNGQDVFSLNTNGFLGQPRATRGATTYDPNLTPEFTTELEIGTDFRLFKNRVVGELTWYDKRSTDLIYAIDVPWTSGYSEFYTNLGEIRNTGWEAGLSVKPVMNDKLTWEVRGAFTKNVNTVEKLIDGLDRALLGWLNYIEPGYPYGYFRGSYSARSDDGQLLIDASTGWPFEETGTPKMIGNPNPDFKLGITNNLSYKGFDLSVLWDWTQGGDFFSENINSMLGRGVTRDTEDRETNVVVKGIYGNPVQVTGEDGIPRYVPLLVNGQTVRNQTQITVNDLYFAGGGVSTSFATNGADEYSIYDGTVYRLREVSLGYSLPKAWVNKLKLTNIHLSISGRNLWYLAPNVPKYLNVDPELNSLGNGQLQGVEITGAPSTKRYGFNLNVTF